MTESFPMDPKKPKRKQNLAERSDEISTFEETTGIRDSDFFDSAKIKKLAYLLAIQGYLRRELERDIMDQHWANSSDSAPRRRFKKPTDQ